MADLIKKIRTAKGDLQIDYNALANLPTISYKVDENGVLRVALKPSSVTVYIGGTPYNIVAGTTWREFVSQHPDSFYLQPDESFTGDPETQMVFFLNGYPVVVDYNEPNGGQICLEHEVIDTSVSYVEY